jgi:hypothetical protein
MFGEKRFHNEENQMHEMLDGGYDGIIYDHPMPNECWDFIKSQFDRFKIPHEPTLIEIAEGAYRTVLWTFGMRDPYSLFFGISDVNMTHDWKNWTFELMDDKRFVAELHPEKIETYAYVPGQAEAVFNECLSKPGLAALPNYLGMMLGEAIDGEFWGEDPFEEYSPLTKECLNRLCTLPDGAVDKSRIRAYMELVHWAAMIWFIGPLGRDIRRGCHTIIDVTMEFGESILSECSVYGPDVYRKVSRPPMSCMHCGISAWCVEMTCVSGGAKYICEHCATIDMPRMQDTTCGTKWCKFSQCAYHRYHGMADADLNTMRGTGQMHHMAGNARSVAPVLGEEKRRAIGGKV